MLGRVSACLGRQERLDDVTTFDQYVLFDLMDDTINNNNDNSNNDYSIYMALYLTQKTIQSALTIAHFTR